MGIGLSILLIAIGAIITFAVHATVAGVSLSTIGIILMVVGAIGLIVAMTIFGGSRRDGAVVEERRVV